MELSDWGRRGRVLAERALSAMLRRGMLPTTKTGHGRPVLLVFNSMFGHALDRPPELPGGFTQSTNLRRFHEAEVVIFYLPALGAINGLSKRPGQVWVAWWMECEQHVPSMSDPAFMSQFDLTMSYRLDADVVTPYFDLRDYDDALGRMRLPPGPKDGFAALFVSSMTETSGRTPYLQELMRRVPVSSYGRVLKNRRLLWDRGMATKLEKIDRFKFTLAFENAIAQDYVTEKLYDPLVMGSVPVYLGAPNVERFAPSPDCYIDVRDFAGPEALAEYLLELDRDDDAYQRYFDWKQRPFRPEFQALIDIQRTDPVVRLCDLVREGLPSDAQTRELSRLEAQ
jgi:glycosyl transferase family 10 (putative fucosyltransferase)